MDKGPFSVEWLAQSSRGGARELPGECRPCPPGPPAEPRRFRSLQGSPEGSPLLTPPPVPAESPREREAAERPGLAAGPAGAAPGRPRTKFSAAQLRELERSFCEQRYIGAGEKRRLATVLNLSQSQVSAASPSARAGHGAGRHLTVTGGRGADSDSDGDSDSDSSRRGGGPGRPPASPRWQQTGLGQTESPGSAPSAPGTRGKWKTVNASSKAEILLGVKIKTWFQNRRMKFKRQTQDARIEALFSGLFLPCHCYPDTAASSYPHGADVNVPATSAASLHPAVPNPALLLPSVPAQSLQPVLPSPALLLPPGPGLSCCSSVFPAVTLTTEHKRLMFQPDLPSC
ncbi:homeobox protein vex1-like [Melozone crissalis]|uniref:homeobox protein vex1-like n=1 Tax=Melozone crissalis TaxID=40204 RepID=UPI0023D9F39D|nr:homeobox protein vex1-like [Melozone crissalis]